MAIGARVIAGSVALIVFRADSAIEVISSLWIAVAAAQGRATRAGQRRECSGETSALRGRDHVLPAGHLHHLGGHELTHQPRGAADVPSRDHLGGAVTSGHADSRERAAE